MESKKSDKENALGAMRDILMESKKSDKENALGAMRDILSPGDTVYGIVRTVSRSGMNRRIDFYAIHRNEPVYLTGYMSTLLGISRNERGLKVSGCGMDMVFATVANLAYALFKDESALKHGHL